MFLCKCLICIMALRGPNKAVNARSYHAAAKIRNLARLAGNQSDRSDQIKDILHHNQGVGRVKPSFQVFPKRLDGACTTLSNSHCGSRLAANATHHCTCRATISSLEVLVKICFQDSLSPHRSHALRNKSLERRQSRVAH